MLCTECNRQIPDDALFCCYCGVKIELKEKLSEHSYMHEQPEKILIKGSCSLIKGHSRLFPYNNIYYHGTAVLTYRRLIYSKYNLLYLFWQPDPLKLTSNQLDIEIPNSEIGWIEEGMQDSYNIFFVYAKGDIKYEFYAGDSGEWKDAISGVILDEWNKKMESKNETHIQKE